MKKLNIPLITTLVALTTGFCQALPQADSVNEAKPIAQAQGRDIMLEFTGKEWCPPCIHLRTKILETTEFEKAVGDKYVLVEVVFPRLPAAVAAIPEEQRNANEKLLAHHRIETGLPTVLLLDAQGLPYAQIAGARRTPADYIKELNKAAATREARDAAFARADKLQGLQRAQALAEGMNTIPPHCRDKYVDVVNEINRLDPQNSLGYARVLTQQENYRRQMKALNDVLDQIRGHVSPAEQKKAEQLIQDFLNTPHLEPEPAQKAWRALGDIYAFQQRYKDVHAAYKKAYETDPGSRLAPRLKAAVQHYEMNILPAVERGEL